MICERLDFRRCLVLFPHLYRAGLRKSGPCHLLYCLLIFQFMTAPGHCSNSQCARFIPRPRIAMTSQTHLFFCSLRNFAFSHFLDLKMSVRTKNSFDSELRMSPDSYTNFGGIGPQILCRTMEGDRAFNATPSVSLRRCGSVPR